jgi:HD-like signal output (HDOD) protein
MSVILLISSFLVVGFAGWLGYRLLRRGREASAAAGDERSGGAKPAESCDSRISVELLRTLIPLNRLSDEELIVFAAERKSEFFSQGSTVFNPGESPETAFFLLEGVVAMESGESGPRRVGAGSPAARRALDRGERCMARAMAVTDVRVLRMSRKILEKFERAPGEEAKIPPPDLTRLAVPPELAQSSLFYVFCRTLQEGRVDLPPLPSVAFKLRQALHEDIDFSQAARIVQADPVLATKLIQVANSPLYLTAKRVTTCQGAISRLGLVGARNLIISMSMKGLFAAKDSNIKGLLQEVWRRSLHLSVLCSVLAGKTQRIDPDKALLGGLIVQIGVIPFLTFAQRFPAEYHEVNQLRTAMSILQGPVGEFVLSQWEFAPEYVELPRSVEDWYHAGGAALELGDIVRLAAWHSYLGTPRMAELPPITDLPAYAKLADGTLTAEKSLSILHEAREQIAEIYKIFV